MADTSVVQNIHPSWFDWITLLALLCGPILALLAQRALDWLREKDKRRKALYFKLMSTRATWLANEHVEALNSIDIVFTRDEKIRRLWKTCLDHLATPEAGSEWNETLTDLRVDLYQAIGHKLGYRYTTDYIKRGIYFPKHYVTVQENQNKMLAGLAAAVEHGRLKVEVIEPPAPPPALRPLGGEE
jgi:hypothetical protein